MNPTASIIRNYTCDKQVLWESAGAFFPRDNSLVSVRKSHSSGVRGLVVRCLVFNPEGSCSNPWVCANFFTSIPKQKVLTFSALWDSSLFSALWFFFENFLMSSKGPPFNSFRYFSTERMLRNPKGSFSDFSALWDLKIFIFHFFRKFFKDSKGSSSFFLKFCNRMLVKKSQRAPFTVFGIVRSFKMNNFCLKIRFSEAQHAISEFFLKTGVFFYATYFLICFNRSPPQFLLKMKRFPRTAQKKDCSRFSGLCGLPETFKTFFEKFRNFFPYFSGFLKSFRLRQMGFLLFPGGEEWFSRFMRIPSGIFWRCEIHEILTMSFYTWFSVWFCLFGFLQKFATFCASVCEARLRLCGNNEKAKTSNWRKH